MPLLRPLASIALLLAMAVPAFVASTQARGADDGETTTIDDTPHITIVGTARAEVAPDLATVTLGVVTEKPGAREASDANAKVAQALVAAAKARGVSGADLATRAVTLTQTFDEVRDASGRVTGRKPRGFEASTGFSIRVRDLSKAGALAQSLIEAGANRFDGIDFSVEHPDPVLERLSAEAVTNARHEARMVADAAGVKLGPILLIERPSAGPAPSFARMKVVAAGPPIEPGTSELTRAMEVTWAIAR